MANDGFLQAKVTLIALLMDEMRTEQSRLIALYRTVAERPKMGKGKRPSYSCAALADILLVPSRRVSDP